MRAGWAQGPLIGIGASIGASVLYGVLFFFPPLLGSLTPSAIYGWRVILTVAALAGLLAVSGRVGDIRRALGTIVARPSRIIATLVNAGILGLQLWLFGWGPKTGNGLDVALGYLLFPIIMMAVGVILFRERFGPLRAVAVSLAAAGAGIAIIGAGGVSWATVAVAAGYPVYFALRRRYDLDSVAVMWWEIAITLPVAIAFTIVDRSGPTLEQEPEILLPLVALGVISAGALGLYMVASSTLTFTTFGILSYVEPVLLVLVSVLVLGEAFTATDIGTFVPLIAALGILAIDARRAR